MSKLIILDQTDIKKFAPAAMRGGLSTKKKEELGRSKGYKFFNTQDTINDLAKLNWFPVAASQAKTWKEDKDPTTVKHMIRFRNPQFAKSLQVGGLIPEILIVNSHDGESAFKFHMGLFRVICSNGLVIADSTFDKFRVRHYGYDAKVVRDYVNIVAKRFPAVQKKLETFHKIRLDEKKQLEFATKAIIARYENELFNNMFDRQIDMKKLKENYKPMELLTVHREGDKGNDLFTVYNRVQENLMKGNFNKYTLGEPKKARAIENIRLNVLINKRLWHTTEEFADLVNN